MPNSENQNCYHQHKPIRHFVDLEWLVYFTGPLGPDAHCRGVLDTAVKAHLPYPLNE
jgi:hypothetical protein